MDTFSITRNDVNNVVFGGAAAGLLSPTLVAVGLGAVFAFIATLVFKKFG